MSELAENIVDWEELKFDPVKQDTEGNWILNPGAPFELTLLNADKATSEKIRVILDDDESGSTSKFFNLQELFAINNLRIKEIEEYKSKYKEQYLKDVENQKRISKKFNTLKEQERYLELNKFRQNAIEHLYEKANCDFESLFEKEPENLSFEQNLFKEYGFENIQTYLSFATNLNRAYEIPSDYYNKKSLLNLIDLGLAIRGKNISKDLILNTLTLKELNAIINNSDKDFKQKIKAIEYVLALKEVDEIINNNIALRQLYKMNPLPVPYDVLDITELYNLQDYRRAVVILLLNTYNSSYENWKYFQLNTSDEGYILEPPQGNNACPCSLERPKKYSKENPPKVPFHIGCSCQVSIDYKEELNEFEDDFFDLSDDDWPEEIKFEPIKKDNAGNWILNPGALFQLTLLNADEYFVNKIRSILDDTESSYLKKNNPLIGLFAGNDFRIKEIEDYKDKYKQQYLQQIENQKNNSTEWLSASDKDKEDLLIEFRISAIETLYENANCDLVALLENEPINRCFDDELIKEFGFENLQTYLKFSDKLNEILIITSEMYYRTQFDELVRLGLALGGKDIPFEEILPTLNLRELNAIADNPDIEYKRKNQAIEYIVTLADFRQRIARNIPLSNLFKLKPFPEKYHFISIGELSTAWKYHFVEAGLLLNTYKKSLEIYNEMNVCSNISEYRIEPVDIEHPCLRSIGHKKTYSKGNPPIFPCHVGCRCNLSVE